MVVVTVIYPKSSDSQFDLTYYLETHIPMVRSRLTPMGMEAMHLLKGTSLLSGPPAYELTAHLHFSSGEVVEKALAAHGDEILGDIPRFTNIQPVIQLSELVV